jgi:hydroxymethylglutaryl-CoA lyase
LKEVSDAARARGIPLRGYLSCVVGCPYEGKIEPKNVAHIAEKLLDLGCREISLGDTIGVATPASTVEMIDAVLDAVGNDSSKLAVHFHDT